MCGALVALVTGGCRLAAGRRKGDESMSEYIDNPTPTPAGNGTSAGSVANMSNSAAGLFAGFSMPDFWSMQQQNNEWSARQAQIDRDWQERMSNTAHQREVQDLIAAGLNPVLSAGGSGASTPSGAMAATDTSASSAYASVLNAILSANSAQAVAEQYNAMSKYIAEMNDLRQKEYPTSLWGALSSATNALRGKPGVFTASTVPYLLPKVKEWAKKFNSWQTSFLSRYGKGKW